MKKSVLSLVLLVSLMLASTATVHAQSSVLGNLLKSIGNSSDSSSTNTGTVGSILGSILGTSKVETKDLAGTWVYSNPAVVFESENLLKSAGGTIAASALEKKMQTYLTRVGITEGKMTMVFATDNTFTATVGTKSFNGKYSLDGSQITLTYSTASTRGITGNVSVSGSKLNITFKADKLLSFITTMGSKVNNSSLNTISTIAASYDGMQLGFEFDKK